MKEGYKKTKLGWIPEEWEVVKGNKISSLITKGASPRWQGFEYSDNGLLFVTSENVKDGKLDLSNSKFLPVEFNNKVKKSQLKNGDILINIVGASIGRACLYKSNHKIANINQAVCLLRPNKLVLPQFILYYLQLDSTVNILLGTQAGSARKNLSLSDIRGFNFLLPPLPEQKKIAQILTTLDSKINHIEAQITQTQTLKKGLMQQLLTKGIGHAEFKDSPLGEIPKSWENLTFGDIVKFSGGAQPPRKTFIFEPKEGYIRLIQTRDYKTDKYKTYIPIESARKKCNKKDIMIGRYGPPIFQIFRGLEGAYNVALMKASPNSEKLSQEYLFYYITRYDVWAFVENLSQRSGGQTGVDLVQLRKYSFPLPPLPEQKKIAQILSTVDSKIDLLENKRSEYQELKKGMMQVLLTGEVRVEVD